jgi:hypothetical protein
MKIEKRWHQPDAMPDSERHAPLRPVRTTRPAFQTAATVSGQI